MIRLRELLQQILEKREYGKAPTPNSAEAMGLERKPGFGNWGPKGQNLVTHRTLKSQNKFSIVPVTSHRQGEPPANGGLKPLKRLSKKTLPPPKKI